MKRPTILDVAAHAKVSKATVSLVLRDSPQIPASTKRRVRASMAAVGYVYNRRAAEMRSMSSRILGLVVANVRNPYFAELTMAIEGAAREAGYTLILGCSSDDVERQGEVIRAMAEHRVDGIILLPASHSTPEDLNEALRQRGLPHALVARAVPNYDCDYVGADNEASGFLVGQHLREIGARQVAFLGGVAQSIPRVDRISGLMRGLAPAVTELCADVSSDHDAAQLEIVDAALALGGLPDAIVAYNDMHAFAIANGLRSRGVEPGRDLALVSFDNVPESSQQFPSLTTADGFPKRVGAAATDLVLSALLDPERPSQRILVAPALQVRESSTTGAAAREPLIGEPALGRNSGGATP